MSSAAQKTVTVHIMDKEYRIACQPGEEEAVLASALHLDERMREIRRTGKIIGSERIAVMVALNMAHELLQQKQDCRASEQELEQRIVRLRNEVESALNQCDRVEL